jgi:hypothetical protein
MSRLRGFDWSKFVRDAIERRLEQEESLEPHSDRELLEEAIGIQDRLRAKSSGNWSGTEEIRRWRDAET